MRGMLGMGWEFSESGLECWESGWEFREWGWKCMGIWVRMRGMQGIGWEDE